MNIVKKIKNFWIYIYTIMSFKTCKKRNNELDAFDIQLINLQNSIGSIETKLGHLELIVQSLTKQQDVTNLSDNLQDDYVNIK